MENDTFCFRHGSTNVLEALRQAVKLKEPVYAFPVQCLDTFHSLGKQSHNDCKVLHDCLLLKPGTTVDELYKVMCHYPTNLLTGDFVRAEVRNSSHICSLNLTLNKTMQLFIFLHIGTVEYLQ